MPLLIQHRLSCTLRVTHPSVPSSSSPPLDPRRTTTRLSSRSSELPPPWQKTLPGPFRRRKVRSVTPVSASDSDILQAFSGSDGNKEPRTHLPIVRSYQCDLARLTLIGVVDSEQALTAAAADGGAAAEEHLSAGTQTMVVETVFPARVEELSTVTTRLFLPAKKVKEKAKRIRFSLTADMLSGPVSRNVLAMTFRQVILQRILSFELLILNSGSERRMEDLGTPEKKISAHCTVSSSDSKILATIAEVICSLVLDTVEEYESAMHRRGTTYGSSSFQKISSADRSVCLYRSSYSEVVIEAKKRIEGLELVQTKSAIADRKVKQKWCVPPTYSNLDKLGGPGCSSWVNEHVPAYKIEADGTKFKDTKFEGWQKLPGNKWEVLLTHFQMVELANIIDIFYEDQFTIPLKKLSFDWTPSTSSGSSNKKSMWKIVPFALLCGCIVASFGILSRLYLPRLSKARIAFQTRSSVPVSDMTCYQLLETPELDSLCFSVVRKIRDALCRQEDIIVEGSVGVWSGELPQHLRKTVREYDNHIVSHSEEASTAHSAPDLDQASLSSSINLSTGGGLCAGTTSAQDIASYQVVLTRCGTVIGFQPTSRLAVNNWASNPMTKMLYRGKSLTPGFFELGLNITKPEKIVLIELLMSVNPNSWFVLARPVK